MSKIPTAEDWLQMSPISHYYDDKTDRIVCFADNVKYAMIEFAKLHCEEQQKEILNQVELITDIDVKHDGPVAKISINNDSILNAYPLENIK